MSLLPQQPLAQALAEHKENFTPANSRKRSREESPASSSTSSSSSTTSITAKSRCYVTIQRSPVKNICQLEPDVLCYLMTFLKVDALKIVVFLSRALRDTVTSYFVILLKKPIFHISIVEIIKKGKETFHRDFPTLDKAMEMMHILSTLKQYNPKKTMVLELEAGVHNIVGTWTNPSCTTYQQTLSVLCDKLSIVGQGLGETFIYGGLVVENGRSLSITSLTIKNPSGYGLVAMGEGMTNVTKMTKMIVGNVKIEECLYHGVSAEGGGVELEANEVQVCKNGECGVWVVGLKTIARLTNFISHNNKSAGVCTSSSAVVDLKGEKTSVHDNEGYGLYAAGTTINVYRPCVLSQVSRGNRRQNVAKINGGIIRQNDDSK